MKLIDTDAFQVETFDVKPTDTIVVKCNMETMDAVTADYFYKKIKEKFPNNIVVAIIKGMGFEIKSRFPLTTTLANFCKENSFSCDTCERKFYNEYRKEDYCYCSLDPCRYAWTIEKVCFNYLPKGCKEPKVNISQEQIDTYKEQLFDALQRLNATDAQINLVTEQTIINAIENDWKPDELAQIIVE